MFDLELAIKNWLKQFQKYRSFDHGELREVELHLRDHIDDLIAEGADPRQAFNKAVDEFGEIRDVAEEETFNQNRGTWKSVFLSTMYKSYMKTSIRRILKHPLSSVINISGLAIAIGVFVLVYSFGFWIDNMDQHHKNKENVFLITASIDRNGETQEWGLSPRPLGETLTQDFNQISKMCRIEENQVVIKIEDQVFQQRITFTDPDYLEMFTFPLKHGVSSALKDKSSIILSHDMAKKYFGEENPIGQEFKIIFGSGEHKIFKVAGVAEKFPPSHIIDFHFLVNYENLELAVSEIDQDDWTQHVWSTLIYLEDTAHLASIESGMDKYINLQNEAMEDWQVEEFHFEPIATLYQNSSDINKSLSSRYYETNKMSQTILTILACFMLALASVNYINISIATASKRLKEIALRKTIGANRMMVISQHLTENIITTFVALLFGMAIGKYVLVPWFEYMNGYESGFNLMDYNLWFYMVGVMLLTALVSGLYPALYISRFQAVSIFNGNLKFGKGNMLTKGFLGLQIVLATILIVCAIMFTQNSDYLRDRDWGYAPDQVMYVQLNDHKSYEQLRDKVQQYGSVISFAGSFDHIGLKRSVKVLKKEENSYEVDAVKVSSSYPDLLGLEILSGRGFIDSETADRNSLIVNVKFVEQVVGGEVLGLEYEIEGETYTIVGTVKDFHYNNFGAELEPMAFMLADPQEINNLVIKVEKGEEMEVYEQLKQDWGNLYPEVPFRGGFQTDIWGSYFSEIEWHGQFWRVIAYVTVFMAALGLFGLVSLNVVGRIREFSVKKVLGANIYHIGKNLLNDYSLLFIISILIGSPTSYYLVEFFFDMVYPYHVPSNLVSILISGIILLSVLLTVVSLLLIQISKANPIRGLKED